MSRYYDKDKLKEALELEQIYDLLELWGAEPQYKDDSLICKTICHCGNSHKLYYYDSTHLFVCYTNCGTFDIFDLAIKVKKNQEDEEWELYDAMRFIAEYFGFEGEEQEEKGEELADWSVFRRHKRGEVKLPTKVVLPEYNPIILTRFAYPRISSWEHEGIKTEISRQNMIGYYPSGEQITIPHFDVDGRLIGIRGRMLDEERADRYGKYRPLLIGNTLYNHPLSMNLYNLNHSQENIASTKTAIVFESEKSCLMYQSYYGHANDISVAVCGSSVSSYHMHLLKSLGTREVILAFDRQFQEIGDKEFQQLKSKLIHLNKKYGYTVRITAIFDKNMITSYKASPIDEGREKFEKLLQERIIPQ